MPDMDKDVFLLMDVVNRLRLRSGLGETLSAADVNVMALICGNLEALTVDLYAKLGVRYYGPGAYAWPSDG